MYACLFVHSSAVRKCMCVCARVQMFREILSGGPDERNASVSKIEIATTILRVSTIIIDLSL